MQDMPRPFVPKDRSRTEHIGGVERIVFRDDAAPFAILALLDGATALGPADPDQFAKGSYWRFLGRWEDDPQRGARFRFSTCVIHHSHSRMGVVSYLTKTCDGIGERIAHRLFEKYGAAAVETLRTAPDQVSADLGIPQSTTHAAAADLDRHKRYEATRIDLFGLFAGRGFSGKLIEAAIEKWGVRAPAVIKRNPFALLGLHSAGFKRCDRLWSDLALPPAALKRQAMCAANAVKHDSAGHTWLSAATLADQLTALIPAADPRRAFRFALRARLLKKYRDAAGCTWLADYRRATAEERIAARVHLLNRSPSLWPADRIPASRTDADRLPSFHQIDRLKRATVSPVGLFLGGPGTGKTHTLAYLLREIIAEFGHQAVCVCAPTGKAAVRASQALSLAGLDIQARTIHSTLGIGRNGHDGDGWGFEHGIKRPLPYRFIVVDESSMIDTNLMADLLDATIPPRFIPAHPEIPERVFERNELLAPRCRRCNRELTDPESREIGYGPECAKHVDPSEFMPVVEQVATERIVYPRVPARSAQWITGTQVLLIGDPYQLPPVGHGAPLRDLIEAGIPAGELTEVRRNAGQIVHACVRIKNGESFETADSIDLDALPPRNLKLLTTKDEAESRDALLTMLQRFTKFHPVWQTQVIVARNAKGELSRKKLNELLHPLLNPDGYAVDGNPFKVGDKIICTRNSRMHRVEPSGTFHPDYREQMEREAGNYNVVFQVDETGQPTRDPEEVYVANGEIGRVVAVAKGLSIARFSEGEALVKIPMGKQRPDDGDGSEEGDGGEGGRGCNFDHAYAITVHKAQGSESPCIIIMADPDAGMIAGREWWYTAVSRASKLCIIVGRREWIDKQRVRQSVIRRKTFLKELIREMGHEQPSEERRAA